MRFLQKKFFSYRVNDTTKPFTNFLDELDKFLQQGHYIIGSVEIMHPENQGLLLFFKHKDELNERGIKGEKNNITKPGLAIFT